jgi:hypothetical protein
VALTWATLAPAPQRVLYSTLDDSERADVTAALDKASIGYSIDSATGALTVDEDDLYRARMTVASDGALATPQSGSECSIRCRSAPAGRSRATACARAQERELTMTIAEIDGVEAVRVHLARPERSVFVREDALPTAFGHGAHGARPPAAGQPGRGGRQPRRGLCAWAVGRRGANRRPARPAAVARGLGRRRPPRAAGRRWKTSCARKSRSCSRR